MERWGSDGRGEVGQGRAPLRIAIITGSRSDWNGLGMVGRALEAAGEEVFVVVTGQHCEDAQTLIDERWQHWLFASPDASGPITKIAGRVADRVGTALVELKPDMAVMAGDRYEVLSAALSASLLGIPIVHIAGGDVTEGSQDDRFRDGITALACVHCATSEYALSRLMQRTHHDDYAVVTGSPAIDRIKATPVLSARETYERFGLSVGKHEIIVSVHPNTVGGDPMLECRVLLAALNDLGEGFNFACLGANADVGGDRINAALEAFCIQHPGSVFRGNVSPQLYYSLLTHCDCMVGNSSAAYYEAPSFGIPCVDIAPRQRGRLVPENVGNVAADRELIVRSIRWSLANRGHSPVPNPYGDGQSAPRIVKAIQDNAWRCKRGASSAQKRETV